MPWLKAGDNAATYPGVMRVRGVASRTDLVLEAEVVVNEVMGWLVRCAMQSAGHMTDYVIDQGTADMLGGARTPRLVQLAKKAKLLTTTRHAGQPAYLLIRDDEFMHIRLRNEVEWERRRGRDVSNPALVVPIKLRDGDACRYCRKITNQNNDRRGTLAGTYDHVNPGVGAETPEDMVVACKGCNSRRGDDPEANVRVPLKDVPAVPYYSPQTAAYLAAYGVDVEVSTTRPGLQSGTAARPQRPAAEAGPAPTTPRATPVAPAPPRPAQGTAAPPQRPGTSGPARTDDDPGPPPDWAVTDPPPAPRPAPATAGSADIQGQGSGSPGTGRDGQGRESTPHPTAPPPSLTPAQPSPARRPRGRRGSRRPPGGDQ